MKFSCAKDILIGAVTVTSKAASSKSTIPALEGILMELDGNKLTLTGYNLDIGIRTEIEVNGEESGSIVINASIFGSVIRKMPAGMIDIAINENRTASITSGATEFSLMCISAEDYPLVPQVNKTRGFTMPQKLLKSMINQTKYACSVVDTKPALMGCKFDISDGVLDVAAVDGVRIALRSEPMNNDDISFIVPQRTLEEITHILSDENDKDVTLSIDKNQISFEIDSYTMISRLIDGEFLDYKKHLSINSEIFAEVSCREITDMLERSMLIINEKNKCPVRCEFSNDELSMNCSTTLGKINDKINIKYNGQPIVIGFNAKYLLDAFKACDTDKVKIVMTNSASSPIIITPVQGDEFKFLLLPMRLK